MNDVLSFQKGNSKLGKNIYTFSLPSGHTCPGANECLSKANRDTGTITDGPNVSYRCFSASQEALYTNVRNSRWRNMNLLTSALRNGTAVDLILNSLPPKANIVRIHVAGDFFSQNYFDTWISVANMRPDVIFYAYTKSLTYWVNRLSVIPNNLKLNASVGGKHDNLIVAHNLKFAIVVYSPEQAADRNLPIDHDDSHAYAQPNSFALLLHGTQPKGSTAANALSKLRKRGIGGYGRQKQQRISIALPSDNVASAATA